MKNTMMRLMMWLTILSVALAGCAFAEARQETEAQPAAPASAEAQQETEADPVILTFNGEEIHWSEIREMASYLADNGYSESGEDYEMAYTTLLNQKVLLYKMDQLGLFVFSEEEEAALRADAQQQWEDAVQAYVSQNSTSEAPTEDELATLRENAEAYFAAYGISPDMVLDNVKNAAAYDRLEAYLADNYDVTVTDEEVRELYDSYVEEDRQYFEGNVPMYEYYTRYMGYEVYYRPEGFRAVLQILLDVDQELMTAYQEKLTAYEAQATAEEPAEPVVTLEEVEEARAAIIASRQDTLDEIAARLDAGEAFADLIPDYNIDPGMSNPDTLASGYEVAADSVLYDAPFVTAAFDENMTAPGAVSNPSVGSYGIYLVYYLRDIPGGAVALTDQMAATLHTNLENKKLNEAYSVLVPQWLAECEVNVDTETLFALSGVTVGSDSAAPVPAE